MTESARLRALGEVRVCSKTNLPKPKEATFIVDALLLQVTDSRSLVRQSLKNTYNILNVYAKRRMSSDQIEFAFHCHRNAESQKLLSHRKNKELARLMQRAVTSSDHKIPKTWELSLTVSSIDVEKFLDECSRLDDVHSANKPIPKEESQSEEIQGSLAKDDAQLIRSVEQKDIKSLSAQTTPSQLLILNRLIMEQLKSKKYTEYDLHCLLQKQGQVMVPLLMLDDKGFNMLHQCIQHSREAFLKVFQAHGHWADLIEQAVLRSSGSEFAGCTPKQMAKRKRMSRFVKEIDRLSQLEKSMADGDAVLKASRAGNVSLLKAIASSKTAELKAKDSEGNSCLHWAAFCGSLDIIVHLTQELKLRPDLLNKNGETPLHVAVTYGQSSLISYLAKVCKLKADQPDHMHKTPQQRTAENGDIKTLSELLKCNVEIEPSIGVIAAQSGRQLYLEHILISYDLDPLYKNSDGKTCLMAAAENGHLRMVEFLLNQYDIPLKDVSKQRRSVFHYVADKGHAGVAKYLLEKARAASLLPLILNQKDAHNIEQLCSLIRGVDKGRSAWHYVHLKRKYVSLFQKRTKGGRIDASQVGTILQSGWGPEPAADVLKSSLQRFRAKNSTRDGTDDFSPTLLAIAKGHADVAKLFIEAGGDIEAKDCFGQTGMHLAAMRGNLDVAVELELHSLALDTKDIEGDTPLDIAKANEHPDLVNFLKGEEHMGEVQKFITKLEVVQKTLSRESLKEVRSSGAPYVINTVSELRRDSDVLLMELGSSPIVQESRLDYESRSTGVI